MHAHRPIAWSFLALAWCLLGSHGLAGTAQVSVTCLSVKFQPSTTSFFGRPYTLKLSAQTTVTDNGELALTVSPDGTSRLKGWYLISSPDFTSPISEDFSVDVPFLGDSDMNGVDDFFQSTFAVPVTQTMGTFEDPQGRGGGAIFATWSRKAGSITGACELEMTGAALNLTLTFQTTFELIEYGGTYTYNALGNPAVGSMTLSQFSKSDRTYSGGLSLSRTDQDHLVLNPFSLTGANGKLWVHQTNETLLRNANTYSAVITLADGDPYTQEPDYLHWHLSVVDHADSNGNGIPDLSDTVKPPLPPLLQIGNAGGVLTLSVTTEAGRLVEVQQSSSLSPASWSTFWSGIVTSPPAQVSAGTVSSTSLFWRAVAK